MIGAPSVRTSREPDRQSADSDGSAAGRRSAAPDGGDEYAPLQPILEQYASLPSSDPRREELRERLVTGYLPAARHLARRYIERGVPLEDLEQVASMGLVKAIDRYDPSQAEHLLAFAIPTMQGELRRYFRDHTWSMRVPRRLKDLHVSLKSATSALSLELGRAPRPSELAARLEISVEEVLEALQAADAYASSSLDQELEAGSEGRGDPLGDLLGEHDHNLELVENHQMLRPLLAALPERERTILMLRFFGEQTQSQIAEQVGLSQMHVSRLLSRTLIQLREQLNASPDGL